MQEKKTNKKEQKLWVSVNTTWSWLVPGTEMMSGADNLHLFYLRNQFDT
mgnify:CR=1 FL=1